MPNSMKYHPYRLRSLDFTKPVQFADIVGREQISKEKEKKEIKKSRKKKKEKKRKSSKKFFWKFFF